ncbi:MULTISPECIES: alpha-L-arabinofuranosidase [Pseudoxanthomonas]|uniref:non-reducing end alpha-L-arabinofuranosidase n=1 Tax=Pseudoxanthomonas taiwanensis J19 TaxID=935569 RepID=A0A562CZI3_9GAMM|nr:MULTISPECIES: alpha-L-arabinofuranosidase [Pseudoxanthomonas]TWH02732.1 alpha-N-arabinofuranosidase [Pseudoxanthomonas taiwanensis J19]
MEHQHKVDLTRRNLLLGSAALGAAAWLPPVFAASGGIRATIDTGATRPPISPMIYGGFIEHIGNLINHSLWSETLDDRKFYYGVLAERPRKPDDRRGAMGFMEKWVAVGPVSAIALDTERPYVGEHSPVVTVDGSQERGMVQHGLALKSGTPYDGRIVLWADPGVTVTIRLVRGDGGQTLSTRVRASSQWQTQRFRFEPGMDTTEARLEIVGQGRGRFGVGAVSLMPADNVRGFRADTVALMKQMNCHILRMPGGNFISAYDWENTIGDPDRRPPVLDPVWNAVQPNDVGVDELLQLCELIGCEPFWCVNTGFGDPRSGAQLVEYVNGSADTEWGAKRAANGRIKPYGVKYWAVGNEMYGHWQYGHMARDQYTVKHNMFVDAMRKVDPDIYIVAPGGFVDEMTTGQGIFIEGQPQVHVGSDRDWAYGMFKDSWGRFDALGTHAYPPAGKRFDLATGKLVDVTQTLNEWVHQMPDRIRTMVDAWEQYKKHFPELEKGSVKVFFDEWAFHFEDDLKGALAIAAAFHEFFRHTDFIAMAGFTMATGWLNFDRTRSQISIKGRMFQFYQERFGTVPVAVNGNSPTPAPKYPVGGDQPSVNTGGDTYPLDVSAALTADGRTLAVAVVNGTEAPHSFSLALQGFRPKAAGRCWKFSGPGPDAKNPLGEPEQVGARESTFDASAGSLTIAPASVEIYHFERA